MHESGTTRALQACLLGLVLLNLVFVHICRGVGLHWLMPLYVLTLAAPVLVRMRESLLYRTIWNGGVIAIFVLLVRDACLSGVHFLLEDGLILAAFCQVHLLNNIGRGQKPDLLFFNSFLIALVTSFFCQDLTYAAVFVVYALLLTVSLQLSCVRTCGKPSGLLVDGSLKAGVTLAVTLVVFLCWPRDFNREGLVGQTLRNSVMEVGFSEDVELGQSAATVATGRIVMRIELLEGKRTDLPDHWRGATFSWFDGKRWQLDGQRQAFGRGAVDPRWERLSESRWARPGPEAQAKVSVEVTERELSRLFAPLASHQLDVSQASGRVLVIPRADGTLTYSRGFGGGTIEYQLHLHQREEPRSRQPRPLKWPAALPHLAVAASGLPPAGRELAARIAGRLEGDPQHRVVEAMRRHLAETFVYLPPGTQGAAQDLEEFLSGAAGGHCEYFATALSLMLRSQGIPSRLVTGYLASEWDPKQRVLTVRAKHAHAWVEVYDPLGTWYTVDPSPAGVADDAEATLSWFDGLAKAATNLWDSIAAFDGESREAALSWVLASPGRLASWLRARPVAAVSIGIVLVLFFLLARRARRRRCPAAVRAYLHAVRRCGLRAEMGETPRELLRRAQAAGMGERLLARLVTATAAHEGERYAARSACGR